ncbi:MAG: hypothetical protein DHS20C02_02140 [Micavibrio sp.]|nr:MAG: hypothetical protein DHS20C02_02140 [Micavibrio sp.]
MTIRSISDVFTDFQAGLSGSDVSIANILDALHERGFGFLLLIFAAPMALPIPVPPGINILLASPLIILTAQQAIGRRTIWMPEAIKKKNLSREKFDSTLNAVIPWMKKLEVVFRPRFSFATQGIFSNIIGLMGLIMALTVCIPLPLTNTVPSLGIALMAIGVIMRDGVAVLGGAIIGTLWVCMLAYAVLFFGAEGIDMVKDTIKSFM